MDDFIYNIWFIYHKYDGNGRKKKHRNIQTKNKEKISRLVALPSPRL